MDRLILHVGTPKTGTSFLQDVLFHNRERLAEQGVLYPADRFDGQFLAALDLMRLPWGGLEQEAVGAWDELAERVRAWDGSAIVSHEILATAGRAHVERALESLHRPGREVHVVLSVRDLVRQIPAEWQENVKHRATIDYADFLDTIRAPGREGRIASWFWGVQEIPDILERWAGALDPTRVHLVTVPPPGSPKDLLWERFEKAFGLDVLDLESHDERANPSLGVPETALVRAINIAANAQVPPRHYRPLVRELLAHQTLSRRTGSPRLSLPPETHAWAEALSRSWVEELRLRGYDVVGDLDDLLPGPATGSGETYADPDRAADADVLDAAVEAIATLLVEAGRLREVEEDLHRKLDEARDALERSYLRPSYVARERVVGKAEHSALGRSLLAFYRAARGRSSRSA